MRSVDGKYERLPALAAELLGRQPAVIVAVRGNAPALAAQAVTQRIPIIFLSGGDPVSAGLVARLSRPGRNVTGVTTVFSALVPKRFELLRELVPNAGAIGALVNPNYFEADLQVRELEQAAGATKQQIQILEASTPADIDLSFWEACQHGDRCAPSCE